MQGLQAKREEERQVAEEEGPAAGRGSSAEMADSDSGCNRFGVSEPPKNEAAGNGSDNEWGRHGS